MRCRQTSVRRVGTLLLCVLLPLTTTSAQQAGGGADSSVRQQPARTAAPKPPLPWPLVDAIGYGGAGFGLGAAMSFSSWGDNSIGGSDPFFATIGLSTLVGLGAGVAIGAIAHRRAAEGQPVGGPLRTGALAGSVLGGATLGALAAIPLISSGEREGTALGSDETTFAITTGVGAALGTLYARRYGKTLPVSRVSAAPTFARDGRVGIRVSTRF